MPDEPDRTSTPAESAAPGQTQARARRMDRHRKKDRPAEAPPPSGIPRRSDRHLKKGRRSAQAAAASGSAGSAADSPALPASAATGPATWSQNRVVYWVAAGLILIGAVLLIYPLGTWTYAWHEQRQLRQELEDQSPGLAAAAEAALAADDLISASAPGTSPDSGDNDLGSPDSPQSLDPVEIERQTQLAAFEAAADAFAAEVRQKTGTPLGRIAIPSIGLDVVMVEGSGYGDPRGGPGHWPDTLFPGQGGGVVVSGHRTTYGAPFRGLDQLQTGDEIDLILPYGVAKYVVTRTIILYPAGMESLADADHDQVSLVGRYSIFSGKERIVVEGDLEAFVLIATAPVTPAD